MKEAKPGKEIFEQWHKDPANWRMGIFYYNKNDKRILPPKRIRSMGWTINFANPWSVAFFILVMLILVLFIFILTKYTG